MAALADDAADAALRVLHPWGGLLILLTLPRALSTATLVTRFLELAGDGRRDKGEIALWCLVSTATLLPATFGRALYVRALSEDGPNCPGFRPIVRGMQPRRLTSLFAAIALLDLCFLPAALTVLGLPLLLLAGSEVLASWESCNDGGPFAAFRKTASRFAGPRLATGCVLISFAGLVILFGNLTALARGGVAIGSAIGLDAARWSVAIKTPAFSIHLAAIALALAEPFWLALAVARAEVAGARTDGRDLLRRITLLRRPA